MLKLIHKDVCWSPDKRNSKTTSGTNVGQIIQSSREMIQTHPWIILICANLRILLEASILDLSRIWIDVLSVLIDVCLGASSHIQRTLLVCFVRCDLCNPLTSKNCFERIIHTNQ